MTAEQVKHIFDRFYRGESADVETPGTSAGLGLGMGIVKQIIEDHGGDIAVVSRPGEGTTVAIHLPIRPATSRA